MSSKSKANLEEEPVDEVALPAAEEKIMLPTKTRQMGPEAQFQVQT